MNLCFALTQAALTRCSATAHTVTRPEGGAGSTSRRTLRFVDRRGRGRWRLTLVVSTAMASDTLNLMLLRENGDSANNDEHLAIRRRPCWPCVSRGSRTSSEGGCRRGRRCRRLREDRLQCQRAGSTERRQARVRIWKCPRRARARYGLGALAGRSGSTRLARERARGGQAPAWAGASSSCARSASPRSHD